MNLPVPPLDWQRAAIERQIEALRRLPAVALNTSDTGTGKTYMALMTAARLDRRAYVIAPKSVKTSWYRACAELQLPESLILDVTNIEKFRFKRPASTVWGYDPTTERWILPPDTLVVWDEAHRQVAAAKGKTTAIMARLKSVTHAIPILAQSATLAENPLKLRSLGFLLGLHNFNNHSFYNWCRAHGCYRSPWAKGAMEFDPRSRRGKEGLALLHTELQSRTVRLRIDDLPTFPTCNTYAKLFNLTEQDRARFQEIVDELHSRCQEAGCNPLVEMLRATQRAELCKLGIFEEQVRDAIEDGHSVVVFVNFREALRALTERLQDLCPVLIHGLETGYTDRDRNEAVARFQANDSPLALCTVAAGLGISLHDIHHIRPRLALLSPSFNAVDITQCLGRIHRAGGTHATQIFVLAAETVEERIYTTLNHKRACLSTLNDGDLDWFPDLQGASRL